MGQELYHHGILGMKWGVRRYQNYDGSLTAAGKQRYGGADGEANSSSQSVRSKLSKASKVANAAKGILDATSTPTDSKESLSDMLRKSNEREKSPEEIAVMRANGKNFVEKFLSYQKEKAKIYNQRGNI